MYKNVSIRISSQNMRFKLEDHVFQDLKSSTEKGFIKQKKLEKILSKIFILDNYEVESYMIIRTNGEHPEKGMAGSETEYKIFICIENKNTEGGEICKVLMLPKKKDIIKNFKPGDIIVYPTRNSIFGVKKQMKGEKTYMEINLKETI